MTTAHDLLAATDLLLLDFDGPVTRLLPPPRNAELTDRLREYALSTGTKLTAQELQTTDHLAIIRAAQSSRNSQFLEIEREATRLETEAALLSPVTPGVIDLLHAFSRQQNSVVIITNNSPQCVSRFLKKHDLEAFVETIIGRDPHQIEHMKPDPWMIAEALGRHPSSNAVMLGDSVSDITAARRAGVRSIGLAKDSERALELNQHGADTVVLEIPSLSGADHDGNLDAKIF